MTGAATRQVMSAIEPTGIGALMAMPSNLPASSGSADAVARAAPVVDGTRFAAAERPRRDEDDEGEQQDRSGAHRQGGPVQVPRPELQHDLPRSAGGQDVALLPPVDRHCLEPPAIEPRGHSPSASRASITCPTISPGVRLRTSRIVPV